MVPGVAEADDPDGLAVVERLQPGAQPIQIGVGGFEFHAHQRGAPKEPRLVLFLRPIVGNTKQTIERRNAGALPHDAGKLVRDALAQRLQQFFVLLLALVEHQLAGVERRIDRTQAVDIALLDTMLAMLANQNLNFLVSGEVPTRLGSAHPNIVPYQVFAVSDGHIMLAVGNDGQFAKVCALLGMPALAKDPRYATNAARVVYREQLVKLLGDVLRTRGRDALLAELEAQGVPAGPINNIDQVFADPQVRHRKMQLQLDAGDGSTLPGVRTPICFSDAELALSRRAPQLGEQ